MPEIHYCPEDQRVAIESGCSILDASIKAELVNKKRTNKNNRPQRAKRNDNNKPKRSRKKPTSASRRDNNRGDVAQYNQWWGKSMVDEGEQDSGPRQFKVVSVEKIDPPSATAEGEWYQYVIHHESSSIEGKRSGSLQSVKEYAEEYAKTLNQRAQFGYSAYATRKSKKE